MDRPVAGGMRYFRVRRGLIAEPFNYRAYSGAVGRGFNKGGALFHYLKIMLGVWLAQLAEHVTLDLEVMSSRPKVGMKPT